MKSQNLHLNRKRLAACNTPNLRAVASRAMVTAPAVAVPGPGSRSLAQDGLHRPNASSFRRPAAPSRFRLVHGLKLTVTVPTACPPQKCTWGAGHTSLGQWPLCFALNRLMESRSRDTQPRHGTGLRRRPAEAARSCTNRSAKPFQRYINELRPF